MNINCTQYKNKEYFERLGISIFCKLEKKNHIINSFSHSTNQSPDWIDNNHSIGVEIVRCFMFDTNETRFCSEYFGKKLQIEELKQLRDKYIGDTYNYPNVIERELPRYSDALNILIKKVLNVINKKLEKLNKKNTSYVILKDMNLFIIMDELEKYQNPDIKNLKKEIINCNNRFDKKFDAIYIYGNNLAYRIKDKKIKIFTISNKTIKHIKSIANPYLSLENENNWYKNI